ncbi:uncharacterized protein DS421_2g34270 [Arachis hypogaea]|nr:uncharacterized protein DS421_2g34270 [Arachis hypogaea]
MTDQMVDIGVNNNQDHLMFKRIFILYIQMAFLLPTTINKVSLVHMALIFQLDNITECNWGSHVLNFIIKGITNYTRKEKQSLDYPGLAIGIGKYWLRGSEQKLMVIWATSRGRK